MHLVASSSVGLLRAAAGTAVDHGSVIAVELVLVQQFADFQLDQLQQFRIVDQVDLVQEHHQGRHVHLASQQHVFTGLGHRAVSGRDHQNSPVHLGGTGNHVLDVVGVTRAVDMRVVTIFRLIFLVARGDGQNLGGIAATLAFRGLGHFIIADSLAQALGGLGHGDSGGQCGFAMIDVTDGAHIHMRFRSCVYLLGHGDVLSFLLLVCCTLNRH